MERLKHPKGFVLTGTDNNGFRHRYSVIKNEQFKKIFVEFMIDLGFDEKIMKETFWSHDDIKGNFELKISEFEDCCRYYENEKYDVDVFYGNKKIIIVIRTRKRESMIVNLETKSRWIKVPKIKKMKEGRSKVPLQARNISIK